MKTMQERIDILDTLIAENRVIRSKWRHQGDDGRERLCLLLGMFPEVIDSSSQCPAGYVPDWFAYLVPHLDDDGSEAAWPSMIRRFAAVMRLTIGFTEAQWDRVRNRWLSGVLSGMPADSISPDVQHVIDLLNASETRTVTDFEWSRASSLAYLAYLAAVDRHTEHLFATIEQIAAEHGSTLAEVAAMNLAKLAKRAATGTLQGSGSDREELFGKRQYPGCSCHACGGISPAGDPPGTWFNACPLCQHKRCPHCDDHRFECTESNAPGQVGTLSKKGR